MFNAKPFSSSDGRRRRDDSNCFTLIELLVVIAIIAILAALLLPMLHAAKRQAQETYCMNNLRQVQVAWLSYAGDFADYLPGNYWPGEAAHTEFLNWLSGWQELGEMNNPDNTNTDFFLNPAYASLGPYVPQPKSYQCCAEKTLCLENGTPYPLCRNISMSVYMGFITTNPENPDFRSFKKLSDVQGVSAETGAAFGPATALVFTEEKANSIDDGEILIEMELDEIANIPGANHDGACPVTFADGHVAIHQWVTSTVLQPNLAGVVIWGIGGAEKEQFKSCAADNADLVWLQAHASIRRQ